MKSPLAQRLRFLSRFCWKSTFCALFLLVAAVRVQSQPLLHSIATDAYTLLGLTGGDVVDVLPVVAASGGLQVSVTLQGKQETVELNRTSVRAPNYQVLVQREGGVYENVAPTPESTYRGSVVGIPGSVVAATVNESGFRGKIILPDGARIWVEPLVGRIAGATEGQHIVYGEGDLAPHGMSCAELPHAIHAQEQEAEGGSAAGSTGMYITQIALDADYEYYLRYGSVAAVENQINTVINTLNAQYESEIEIRHVITALIVRTTSADPYSFTDANLLLNQFRTHWQNTHTGIVRDVAQLFTGKDLDSNIIGIAYPGSVCTSLAYGVVESDYNGNALAFQSDLSAHELGHNWDASHCACANPPYTMNASITGANRFHPTLSIPSIRAFRNSRGCLDYGDELVRIIINSSSDSYEVGQADQLSVIADFRYGEDVDVTVETEWSVDRPEFAFLSPEGLLVILDADAESCLTINAAYSYDGMYKTDQKKVTLRDPVEPMVLVSSNPATGSIDARRPSDPDGTNPVGWNTFDLTLNSEPCALSPSRFAVTQSGVAGDPPVVSTVTKLNGNVVRLVLNKPINPGAWTTIADTLSEVSLKVGYLPGDVNGNGTTHPSDILELIDALNGLVLLPNSAADLDRSGVQAPADIVTLIDLLNGAGGFDAWNGASLPHE